MRTFFLLRFCCNFLFFCRFWFCFWKFHRFDSLSYRATDPHQSRYCIRTHVSENAMAHLQLAYFSVHSSVKGPYIYFFGVFFFFCRFFTNYFFRFRCVQCLSRNAFVAILYCTRATIGKLSKMRPTNEFECKRVHTWAKLISWRPKHVEGL